MAHIYSVQEREPEVLEEARMLGQARMAVSLDCDPVLRLIRRG